MNGRGNGKTARAIGRWLGVWLLAAALLGIGASPVLAAWLNSFEDDNLSIFEAEIEALATAGITRGCNPPLNTAFCPDGTVTRGQMAAFLVRALDLPASSADLFVDDDNSVFEADIQALAAAGITRGCNPPDNDRFCSSEGVTRGQMAAFLSRALGLPVTPPVATLSLDGPPAVAVAGGCRGGDGELVVYTQGEVVITLSGDGTSMLFFAEGFVASTDDVDTASDGSSVVHRATVESSEVPMLDVELVVNDVSGLPLC